MTHSQHANWAAADAAGAGRIEERAVSADGNSAASTAVREANKAPSTLRATLALRGFELHPVSDGDGGMAYLVRRWNLCRKLPSLQAVRGCADRAGVRS